jgi:Na+-driven multidrug efflux pump
MYQAILKGAGKQEITSMWNIIMSIFWMIPVSYILCFGLGFGIFGIWSGCISYVVILMIVNFYYYSVLNIIDASDTLERELIAVMLADKYENI